MCPITAVTVFISSSGRLVLSNVYLYFNILFISSVCYFKRFFLVIVFNKHVFFTNTLLYSFSGFSLALLQYIINKFEQSEDYFSWRFQKSSKKITLAMQSSVSIYGRLVSSQDTLIHHLINIKNLWGWSLLTLVTIKMTVFNNSRYAIAPEIPCSSEQGDKNI